MATVGVPTRDLRPFDPKYISWFNKTLWHRKYDIIIYPLRACTLHNYSAKSHSEATQFVKTFGHNNQHSRPSQIPWHIFWNYKFSRELELRLWTAQHYQYKYKMSFSNRYDYTRIISVIAIFLSKTLLYMYWLRAAIRLEQNHLNETDICLPWFFPFPQQFSNYTIFQVGSNSIKTWLQFTGTAQN